jgi:hypothetical protein
MLHRPSTCGFVDSAKKRCPQLHRIQMKIKQSIGVFSKPLEIQMRHYSPLYPEGGHSRCGMLTTMPRQLIDNVAKQTSRKLSWVVDFRKWNSEKDYEPLEMVRQRTFFSIKAEAAKGRAKQPACAVTLKLFEEGGWGSGSESNRHAFANDANLAPEA